MGTGAADVANVTPETFPGRGPLPHSSTIRREACFGCGSVGSHGGRVALRLSPAAGDTRIKDRRAGGGLAPGHGPLA